MSSLQHNFPQPQPGSNSFLKAAIDGLNGSGKTGTAARLAIGISKEYANHAPVIVFDSEERWRFLKPVMFEVERVPLVIVAGKSLVTLRQALKQASTQHAAVFVGDQLTTPWMEGLRAFSFEDGRLPFDKRQQLMNQWEPVIEDFRYGKFHAICCGRLGYQWSRVEDENGNLELQQGDSKFNAGGGNNFGYEADLELEMRRHKRVAGWITGRKTNVEYVCDVVKDAAGGFLNNHQFVFPSSGPYKAGDYKPILDAFRPYLEFMRRVEAPEPNPTSAREYLVSGKTPWARDQTERKGLLEELDANLQMCFPSGEGKSKLAKMFRDLALEYLNGFISWSRMEEETKTEQIERNVLIAKAMRKRIEAKDIPTDQASLQTLLDLSTEDVQGRSGRHVTLLEAMGLRSVAEIRSKKGPQGIVAAMDYRATDEVVGD